MKVLAIIGGILLIVGLIGDDRMDLETATARYDPSATYEDIMAAREIPNDPLPYKPWWLVAAGGMLLVPYSVSKLRLPR